MTERIPIPEGERGDSSDDTNAESEELTAAEAAEIQRQTQLKVERFEAGIEG
jgi:hypothetical protein